MSRWARVMMCVLPMIAMTSSPLTRVCAQGLGGGGQGQGLPGPDEVGSWDGPWSLTETINEGLEGDLFHWDELAHALVLPPPNDGWVLFWCARYCADGCGVAPLPPECTIGPYETFLWDSSRPQNVYRVALDAPLNGDHGEAELFCSGHGFSPEGHVVTFGGTDLSYCPQASVVGLDHNKVWVFDNSTVIDTATTPETLPGWTQVLALNDMKHGRWYPTALMLTDGKFLVSGHVDFPPPAGHAGTEQELTMERGSLDTALGAPTGTVTWDTSADPFFNREYDAGCAILQDYNLRYYPRMFQLTTGRILCLVADDGGFDNATGFIDPNDVGFLDYVGSTLFLEREVCVSDPDAPDRYHVGATAPLPTPGVPAPPGITMPRPIGAPAVHLIDDRSGTEVVYSFGGSMYDGASFINTNCPPGAPPGGQGWCCDENGHPVWNAWFSDTTREVVRMLNPGEGAEWDNVRADGQLRLMREPRMDANAVVLLDGSILVVGGFGQGDLSDPASFDGEAKRKPELYRPPEIFNTGDTLLFHLMKSQLSDRRYHSVAGLLPDGRVFSAGGEQQIADGEDPCDAGEHDPPPSAVSDHRFEIYSPPYLYQGTRPVIRNLSGSVITRGDSFSITASLPGGPGDGVTDEFRVALLRPGSITHAFDSNQIYIILDLPEPPVQIGANWQIPVMAPTAVPPGQYMVTVVSKSGVPSETRWLELN